MVHRLAGYLRTRGRAAAGRGGVLARDRPGVAARVASTASSGRRRRPGPACASSTSRRAPARRAWPRPPRTRSSAPTSSRSTPGRSTDLPAGHDERRRAAGLPGHGRHGRDARAGRRSGPRPTGRAGRARWSTRWRTRWPRPRSRRRRTTCATGARSGARARSAARAGRWSHDDRPSRCPPRRSPALVGQPPPDARAAARHRGAADPSLVVAGAGSGKTETMAARVVWLLANGVVEPDQVLGLTFTRKAAGELAERVRKRLRHARPRGGGRRASRSAGRRRAGARRARRPGPADDLHLQLVRGLAGRATTRCGSASTRPRACSARPPSGSWPARWSRRGATTSTPTRRRRP